MNKSMHILSWVALLPMIVGCEVDRSTGERTSHNIEGSGVKLIVLGNVQDAGSPHAACKKSCCVNLFEIPDPSRKVVSLGLLDYDAEKSYLFEATPDLPVQMKLLSKYATFSDNEVPDGIFLTHAHIGHYAGLMYLGKEAMSADRAPVYAMPKMKVFLESNGPWDQLLKLNNIELGVLASDSTIALTNGISVKPFLVPHRDEYSETVGFKIMGPNKSALFIPDINKWSVWEKSLASEIKQVDYAFLDATFYDEEEIKPRDISEIPHPFIVESMELLKSLPETEKMKVYFIHFNHTNPVLDPDSEQTRIVESNGFNIARMQQEFQL